MKKWVNTIFFGLCFIAASLIELYSIQEFEGNLVSTVALGVVVLITGYIFMDTIRSKVKKSKEDAKFYLDHLMNDETEKWNQRYTELLNLQKASYAATKKSTAQFTKLFEEVLFKIETLEDINAKAQQKIIELQRKVMEGQKNALNLQVNYEKENSKHILEVLSEDIKSLETRDQLLEILAMIANNHELLLDRINQIKLELPSEAIHYSENRLNNDFVKEDYHNDFTEDANINDGSRYDDTVINQYGDSLYDNVTLEDVLKKVGIDTSTDEEELHNINDDTRTDEVVLQNISEDTLADEGVISEDTLIDEVVLQNNSADTITHEVLQHAIVDTVTDGDLRKNNNNLLMEEEINDLQIADYITSQLEDNNIDNLYKEEYPERYGDNYLVASHINIMEEEVALTDLDEDLKENPDENITQAYMNVGGFEENQTGDYITSQMLEEIMSESISQEEALAYTSSSEPELVTNSDDNFLSEDFYKELASSIAAEEGKQEIENASASDWSVPEEPETEAVKSEISESVEQPKVIPLYDDPNKALSADEIAALFASFGQ